MYQNFVNAQTIYEKNPDLRHEDIEDLITWMRTQPHLPEIQELQLLLFFYSCYYDTDATKRCIENYYTTRSKTPIFFTDRNVLSEELQFQLQVAIQTPLPQTTNLDYMVFYIRLMDTRALSYVYSTQIRMLDMAIHLALMQCGPKPGFVALFDMEGTSFAHLFRINPFTSKKFVDYVQEALPVRLKAVHLINVNSFTAQFINLLKPFMKKDLVELLHVHRSLDTLYNEVPQKILPKEFGGEAGTIEDLHAVQVKNMADHADFFLEDEKLKSDENKRPSEGNGGFLKRFLY